MKKFTWEIGFFCNFKCFYCFYSYEGWESLLKKQQPLRSTVEVIDAWKNIYEEFGKSKLYITGGEPFLYPDFIRIIKEISKFHEIEITSNLSTGIENFVSEVKNTENIDFNSTFHPMFMKVEKFLENVLILRKKGFKCRVSYLAHPAQIKEIFMYKEYFLEYGINMTVVKFVGNFNGRNYPEDYDDKELEFLEFVSNYNNKWQFLLPRKEAIRNGEKKINNGKKKCIAGYSYAHVNFKGDVTPCGQLKEPLLGNIFENNVKFLNKKIDCDRKTCKSLEFKYEKD